MQITNIAIDGFGKLRNYSTPLEQFNLFVGLNGVGKTMVLNAVSVGLIGYVPELGNKPALTKGRMSGRIGTISLQMTGGGMSITFPPVGNPSERRTGDIPKLDPMFLDIGRFFGMTGPQRVKFLLGLSNVEVPQPADVMSELYADTFSKHKMTRAEWDPIMKPIFDKFSATPVTSLDWLSALKDEAVLAKQTVAGITNLRDTALKLERDLQPTNEAPVTDQSHKLRELSVKIEEARKAHQAASNAAANQRGKVSSLTSESAKQMRESLDKPDSKCPTCGSAIRGLKKESNVKASLEEGSRRKAQEAQEAGLLLPGMDAETSRLKGELDMMLMQKDGLDAVQRKFTLLTGGQIQLDRVRLEIQLLEEKEAILKTLPNWIAKFQGDLLEKSLGPVCEMASSIVKERFGMTVGIDGGDFVLIDGESKISLDCASGGQRLLATIGIQVALMQKSPFKIVMVDELGRVDDKALIAMSHMVGELIQRGLIHQFIGTRPEISGALQVLIKSAVGQTASSIISL